MTVVNLWFKIFVKLIPSTTCQRKSITLKIWPRELKIILLRVMTKCSLISLSPQTFLINHAGHNLLSKL
ncbi:putative phosphatidylinositol-specific phospholipase C (PI-PLC) [Candida albicans P60002]|nr:putative phosphatidylinositol-specific phospholipase C (PI-PLC) [Candida albicans P60002]